MNDLKFNSELLTVEETATYLKVSRVTAYNLFNRNDFPTIRLGKLLRVYKCDLVSFVRDNLVQRIN